MAHDGSLKASFRMVFLAYTERWNSTPHYADKEFIIRTSFDKPTNTLAAGKTITLNIDLEVKNDAEYIMIELPIPAGCFYQSKSQRGQTVRTLAQP